MASYLWTAVYSLNELPRYHLPELLRLRAIHLLTVDAIPIEIGEMWYRGNWKYRLRHSPRVDYQVCVATKQELYITHDGPDKYWVMSQIGPVHSVAFLSLDAAEKYMQRRKEGF